jgi:hypothetical protein
MHPIQIANPAGRPLIDSAGSHETLPTYSGISWRGDFFEKSAPAFMESGVGGYWIGIPQAANAKQWGASPFWNGDTIRAEVSPTEFVVDMDAKAAVVLDRLPGARLLVRNLPVVAPSWNQLHPDQLFVDEEGRVHDVPSLASAAWWKISGEAGAAAIRYCENRPWADRIIGYWFGLDSEGTPPWLFAGKLFDHSPVMTSRWREWLREKYGSVENLRTAYADETLAFATIPLPKDRLRGSIDDVAKVRYWEQGPDHQPLADYLELQGHLMREGVQKVFQTLRNAFSTPKLLFTDAFKQAMAGWHNFAFFDPKFPYPLVWPETLAGAGSQGVATLLDDPNLDGVVTPIDYQLRGVGGITEPEGIVDSVVLRGKFFFAECDIRTWHDDVEKGCYGTAKSVEEFAAINWRNIATGLTRGFNPYWMDLLGDWFGTPEMHRIIARSVEVMEEAAAWPHHTEPGIAVILDDRAAFDTNGNGAFMHEAIHRDLKTGLSRCGVPYRLYLLEDLELPHFPAHRLFYFPNLFRVTEEKLDLLERKVFRDGNMVLWGPGSGISDGEKISAESASRLTRFSFDWLDINDPRLVQVTNFEHPVTRGLPEDTFFGADLAYGPLMTPTDGVRLATCHGRSGKARGGLAIKDFRGTDAEDGGWISVFSATVPLPAALWRELARFAGAHVYCETNDILLASREVVALHSVKSGRKEILLPRPGNVVDLITGETLGVMQTISFALKAPGTRLFRVENE